MALSRFTNLMKRSFFSSSKNEASKMEIIKNDINAIARLMKVEEDTASSNVPLKNTTLKTVKLLWEAYDGKRSVTARDIQNALFIDSPEQDYPVVQSLINKGATYTNKDVELIKQFDEPAAEFLSKRLSR